MQKLTQDQLKLVGIPGADADTSDKSIGKATGVVFNPAPITSDLFVVRDQWVDVDGMPIPLGGSARFISATDSGKISAWTEQAPDGAIVRRDGGANQVFDGSAQGMAFFGIALSPSGDKLLAADFGADPQVRTFDKNWQPVAATGFANPFATGEVIDASSPEKGKKAAPGDPAPFNITTLGSRVFVSYAMTRPDGDDPKVFDKAEEASLDADKDKDSHGKPDKGKVAEFDSTGKLVRIIDDGGRLNAPWGVAIAPSNFGALSGKLLIGNSGGLGRVLAYDDTTGTFVDYLRDGEAKPVEIAGLWALKFGNGESLGDANALYFTAGPRDERTASRQPPPAVAGTRRVAHVAARSVRTDKGGAPDNVSVRRKTSRADGVVGDSCGGIVAGCARFARARRAPPARCGTPAGVSCPSRRCAR